MRPQRYTAQQVIDALHQMHGLVHLTAKYLRCDPETIHNYCKRYPAVQAAKVDARSELVDVAEAKLWEAVHRGEPWALALVLKTLGRDRGYVDRQEITGKDGGPVQHAHIHLWEERLQAAHRRIAAHKAAILEQRALEAGQGEDSEGRS